MQPHLTLGGRVPAPFDRTAQPTCRSLAQPCTPVPALRSSHVCRTASLNHPAEAAKVLPEVHQLPSVPVLSQGDGGDGVSGTGNNGGGGGGGGDGNSGAGGSGGHGKPLDPRIAAILAGAGRSVESFPSSFSDALVSGKVTPEVLTRFLELEKQLFAKLVWGIEGFRERLLADPSFPVKLGIELGIGVAMKLTAEYTKRRENFVKEADFVIANTLMAIFADFMLTWLPAPTLSYKAKAISKNPIANFFASCPDNAFQKVPPGMDPFTLNQRIGAIIRNGSKLLAVGFCASLMGVGITNTLTFLRQKLDPNQAEAPKPAANLLGTSLAYGVYMSVSSNLRYQIVAGVIEERGIETLFAGNHNLCHALSFVTRTLNTFVGSLLWVDFARLTGMQKSNKGEDSH